jgi:iron complex outermembrane recepter protein
MRSLSGAVRSRGPRVSACALGTILSLCATLAAAQVTAPALEQGSSFAIARPDDLAASETATAVVEVLIGADGIVQDAQIVDIAVSKSDAEARLREVVLSHARGLRFLPAQRGELAVPVRTRVRLQLAAAEGEGPQPSDAPAPERSAADANVVVAEAPPPAAAAPNQPAAAPRAHARTADSYGAHARLHVGVGAAQAVAASDMDIEPGALAQVPRLDAQSYLTLSPGVVLANHAGIGHVSSVFLRGFDAGEGQDLEVRVDDVPINEPSNAHEHGYADPGFVIPETVERLRVQQGTFDPRQGDFAVAGSVGYTLGVKERGLRAQLGVGSFNEQRGLLLWAPTGTSKGTFAALDLRRGDGFGPERAHQGATLLARYAGALGPVHYSLLFGSHVLQFDSAGVVRQDAVDARTLPCPNDPRSQFFCAQDSGQGGSAQRQLLRGALIWARPGRRFELMTYGMLRGLRIRENFTGSLLDARGDGQDEGYKAGTVGMQTSYVLTPSWLGRKQRVELGVSARHDAGETRMWRLRSNTAVPYETVFDRELSLTHIAGYLRGELTPRSWLSLRGGVRVDNFGFHTEDQAAPESDRVGPRLPRDARDAWGTAVSPRAALVLAPLPGFTWSFSAGQGVRSSDAQALSEGERAPFARVLSLETGPTWSGGTGPLQLTAHAFAFATRVSNDLLFDPVRGRNIPIGPSNRYGAALSARARVGRQHDTLASYTWSDARGIDAGDSIFALGQGNVLPYVPRNVLRIDHVSGGELRVAGELLRLQLAGGLGWVGPMPMPLGAASYARWQLDASLRVRVRAYELALSAINLFDIQNRASELYYASSFGVDGASSMRAARHYAAGAPRSFWLTLTIFLDEMEIV